MKRPNFFIIGAPKCGTTSLANWLGQHREVYFSPVKEPHYFNRSDEHHLTRNLAEYEALFAAATAAHKAVGEGSTWYLNSPEAVPGIEAYTGGTARYIVCLRNPVDMAHSLHSEMHVNGNEPEADFARAWGLQADRASGAAPVRFALAPDHLQYRQSCALGTMVQRLYDTVPADRVRLFLLEDIADNPAGILREVAGFLGISDDLDGIDFAPKNAAKRPASRSVVRFVALVGAAKRRLGIRVGLGLINRLRRWNTVTARRETLDPAFRAALTAEFEPEIARLEQLTGRSLEHWRA